MSYKKLSNIHKDHFVTIYNDGPYLLYVKYFSDHPQEIQIHGGVKDGDGDDVDVTMEERTRSISFLPGKYQVFYNDMHLGYMTINNNILTSDIFKHFHNFKP